MHGRLMYVKQQGYIGFEPLEYMNKQTGTHREAGVLTYIMKRLYI